MTKTTIRFSDDERDALEAIAKRLQRSQNEIVREAFRNHPAVVEYFQQVKTQKNRESDHPVFLQRWSWQNNQFNLFELLAFSIRQHTTDRL